MIFTTNIISKSEKWIIKEENSSNSKIDSESEEMNINKINIHNDCSFEK
jgi:hypothetical protein